MNWYPALMLSALALCMFIGTRKPVKKWRGSPRTTFSEKPFLWEHELSKKYRPLASRIGIAATLPFSFRVEEEGWSHRITKWLGFCEEFQTEHAEFDHRVYIISDDKLFQQKIQNNVELHHQISRAFVHGAQRIYYLPGYLIIRLKKPVAEPPAGDAEILVDILYSLQRSLSGSGLPTRAAMGTVSLPRSLFKSLPAFFLLGGFITLMLNIILGFRIIQWDAFMPYALRLAGAILLAVLVCMRLVFRRSSYGHDALLHLLQWGSWSALFFSGTVIWFANCHYDVSSPKQHGGKVLEKHITTARRSKTFYISLADWHAPEQTISVQVNSKLYKRLKLSDDVVITSRSGQLGMEWIENVDKLEK
jgi:hypothetical protein